MIIQLSLVRICHFQKHVELSLQTDLPLITSALSVSSSVPRSSPPGTQLLSALPWVRKPAPPPPLPPPWSNPPAPLPKYSSPLPASALGAFHIPAPSATSRLGTSTGSHLGHLWASSRLPCPLSPPHCPPFIPETRVLLPPWGSDRPSCPTPALPSQPWVPGEAQPVLELGSELWAILLLWAGQLTQKRKPRPSPA